MAIPFLNDINLDQNELLNGVIHKSTSSTRPATPVVGQLTYDTDEFTLYSWNGTAWVTLSDADAVLSIIGTSPINASEDGNRQVTISVDDASTSGKGVVQLAGDLGGTATAVIVTGVGFGTVDATTANEIATAVGKSHDQNTDTGTTSATFQLNSTASGVLLKDNAGVLEIRNAGDTAYASLKVNDLTITGDLTYIHSTEVFIGDSFVVLNNQVLDSASNFDGGIEVKRLHADAAGTGTVSGTGTAITGTGTTFTNYVIGDVLVVNTERRVITEITSDTALVIKSAFTTDPSGDTFSVAEQANAKIFFDVSTNKWHVTEGATNDLQTLPLVKKFSADVGDGTTKDFVLTHNLNTQDVTVAIRQVASPFAAVMTDWEATSVDTITVRFKKAPTTNQYRVIVTG
jgi:hypothetical protein